MLFLVGHCRKAESFLGLVEQLFNSKGPDFGAFLVVRLGDV